MMGHVGNGMVKTDANATSFTKSFASNTSICFIAAFSTLRMPISLCALCGHQIEPSRISLNWLSVLKEW